MLKYCPNCATEVVEGSKFCKGCGTNLQDLFRQPAPEQDIRLEDMESTEIPSEEIPETEEEEITTEPEEEMEEPVKPKSKKPMIAVAVIVGIVVIIAIIFFTFQGSKDSPFASLTDTDGDGYNDDVDRFINDPNEWKDSDNDKVGDNSDAFPNDSSEQYDKDNDGIGDNADFFDEGNGGIFFKVTRYAGDTYDDYSYNDPYFMIWFDINNNSIEDVDEYSISSVYTDTENINNPHSFEYDINDSNNDCINMYLYVWDSDFWDSDDVIDVHPNPNKQIIAKTCFLNKDTVISFDADGKKDGIETEEDAYIECEYGIKKIT